MKRIITLICFLSILLFSTQYVTAEVPLPDDINIVPPSSDLPQEIAAFSGKWEGNWDKTLDAILIVEEIGPEKAKIIYAWGDAPEWNTKKGFKRYKAKVITGQKPKLEFMKGKFTVQLVDSNSIKITREREEDGTIDETKLKKAK